MQYKKPNKTSIRVLLFVCTLLVCADVESQTMTVGGTDWTPIIPKITESGSDYAPFESPDSQITLSLPSIVVLGTSKVSVKYVPNPNWDSSLKIDVKKLNNGSGFGICLLCSMTPDKVGPYLEISTNDLELFRVYSTVSLAINNISLKIRLRPSVVAPVQEYKALVVFTIGPT